MQRQGRTIQGELERGLQAIMGRPVRVVAAGRTDAGVHARGQVVHLAAPWAHSLDDLKRAWNANLPQDIAVRALAPVSPEFHARFSARSRVYRYSIYNAEVRSPLRCRYAWHVNRPLDAERMARAAALLVGTHDLATFGRAPQGENTVRTVMRAQCRRNGDGLAIEVEANAFLQHMMRRVAFGLAAVGLGHLAVEEFRAMINARDPRRVEGIAPPNGLCLLVVHYDPGVLNWPLPSWELWQKEICFE